MVRSGLLRLVPASEVPEVRRELREDFAGRFRDVMGHDLAADDAERWWPV